MQKCDAFSFGADARCFVDQANARRAATLEGRVEVGDGEANVMNTGAALLQEFADWRVGVVGFEQLDKGRSGGESYDVGAVGVGERNFSEA